MTIYFDFVEFSENRWIICPRHEAFGFPRIVGSYGVMVSRFFGLDWVDWLRYCEQNGATLQGKKSLYITAFWKTPNKTFLAEINKRVNEIAKHINIKELKY